jgi:hypothetical protein
MKVRNASDKDITLSISGRTEDWKKGTSIELSEGEWNLIMGSTGPEKLQARTYWEGQFPDCLPRLIPQRGRVSKEESHGNGI